jgi:ribosomal protein S18 acetylase RimI-like enzyme
MDDGPHERWLNLRLSLSDGAAALAPFKEKCVAIAHGRVMASGRTWSECIRAARDLGLVAPRYHYVPLVYDQAPPPRPTFAPDDSPNRLTMELDLAELTERAAVAPDLRIEPWVGNHVEELGCVMRLAYEAGVEVEWSTLLRSEEGCVEYLARKKIDFDWSFVAWAGDVPVGLVQTSITRQAAGYVDNVFVHPAHRVGVGRALVLTSAWRFKDDGIHLLGLHVTRTNATALRLYEGMGFRAAARRTPADGPIYRGTS